METNIENLLQDYKNKTEETSLMHAMQLNIGLLTVLQKQRANSKLRSLAAIKIIAVILGIIWVLFLAVLVYGTGFNYPYFSISASAIIIFTVIAIVVYIKHFILIRQINYSESITATQKKLSELKLSTINVARVLFLQMPFYTTWFWSSTWIHYDELNFWLITFPITLAFTVLAIWLYKNISPANSHKKWFRILFNSPEWTLVIKANEFIKVIDDFENEEA